MKRLLYLILILSLAVFVPVLAHAAGMTTYYIEEADMYVDVPDEYIVLSRDLQPGDPALSFFGVTAEEQQSIMAANDLYLDICEENLDYEILIKVMDNLIDSLEVMNDSLLLALVPTIEPEYEKVGVTILSSEVYHHEQAKFLKLRLRQYNNGRDVYSLQYYTVHSNKAINITLHSYSGEVSEDQEQALKVIVDSAAFGGGTAKSDEPAAEPEHTPAFLYTDEKSGVSFTVPADWKQKPFNQERQFINAQFVSTADEGVVIILGSYDAWDMMSPPEKLGMERYEFDNSATSHAEIAEMLIVNESDISTVVYNEAEYFKTKVSIQQEIAGFTLSLTPLYFMHIENGYVYSFQFYGEEESVYFRDFEALLSSVEYPPAPSAPASSPTESSRTSSSSAVSAPQRSSSAKNDLDSGFYIVIAVLWCIVPGCIAKHKGRSFWAYFGLSLLITPLITIIITLCIKKRTRLPAPAFSSVIDLDPLHPHSPEKLITEEPEETPPPRTDELPKQGPIRFCRYCGYELIEGSVYCSRCGRRLTEEGEE